MELAKCGRSDDQVASGWGKIPAKSATAAPRSPKSTPPDSNAAQLLRDKADSLESKLDQKLHPAIANQNPTRRRMRIAESMRQEAYRMQDTQFALRVVANNIDAETPPSELWEIRSIARIERILHGRSDETQHQRDLLNQLIENAKRGSSSLQPTRDPTKEKILRLEAKLVGQKIPGFFPTPSGLADRMVQLAEIDHYHEILEPSAGKGDIAQAIVRHGDSKGFTPELTCIEINHQLSDLLELKGFNNIRADFMDVEGEVDRIVMNPAYEKCIDIEHVLHAYDLLKPGGILVALMGEGAFFRKAKRETEFRSIFAHWESTGQLTHQEQLVDAFKGPQSFNQTGVRCRLLVVEKGHVTNE